MQLSDIITKKISSDGPVSFHDFMELALYHPGAGYYTSLENQIGKKGDYYTSASLTPAFGAMIGRQFEEMWKILGENAFTVVEYGAGTGFLCRDILAYLESNRKLFDQLNYCIIEKSPAMRAKERTHLDEKVSWYDSIKDIPAINGCIFSNELLDNFSVHQVIMNEELMEIFVDYRDGFVELLKPAKKELTDYLAELKVDLPTGFRAEINLEATQWIKEIAASLHKGYVLTIDYGFPSAELYRAYRSRGTLVCYNQHTINECPYTDIGKQDITSHVNFSALHHWGEMNGLDTCGFTDQAHFLVSLGLDEYLEKTKERGRLNEQEIFFLKKTLVADMGRKFKVLIQSKGIPGTRLSGLKCNHPLFF